MGFHHHNIFRNLTVYFAFAAAALIFQPPGARAEVTGLTVASLGPACAICNGMLEGKLKHVPGIEKVVTNLKDSTFTLVPKAGQPVDVAGIKKAVKDSGYGFRFIELTMKGTVADANGSLTFKDPASGQTFQLVQAEGTPLSEAKRTEIQSLSSNGQKPVEIKGKAYPGTPMDGLEPTQVAASQ